MCLFKTAQSLKPLMHNKNFFQPSQTTANETQQQKTAQGFNESD